MEWDLLVWLLSFFILIALLGLLVYQLMCLADLEFDYINPYDSAARINSVILPEFVIQGVLSALYILSGHWIMFLFSAPNLYYNVRLEIDLKGPLIVCSDVILSALAFKRTAAAKLKQQISPWLPKVSSGVYPNQKKKKTKKKKGPEYIFAGPGPSSSSSKTGPCDASSGFPYYDLLHHGSLNMFSAKYTEKQHLIDVTEIFNLLNREKKRRLFKLIYLVFLLFLSIFWMVWKALDDD